MSDTASPIPCPPLSGKMADFPRQDPAPFFLVEHTGWKGFIEWEKYPEKKTQAEAILARYQLPGPPGFQLTPLVEMRLKEGAVALGGVRWKQYHYAMGPTLEDIGC